jgi:hypothetical protein
MLLTSVVLTLVNTEITVFWGVTCAVWQKSTNICKEPAAYAQGRNLFYPEDGGSRLLQIVCTFPPSYTASLHDTIT